MASFNFTTGPSTLPDVGTLSYNGCVFSPLFETTISGTAVKDDAGRTVKYLEILLTADGYVTLATNASSVSPAVSTMSSLLTAQGGVLNYLGRGFDLVVNVQGAQFSGGGANIKTADVAWGPVPQLIEFQPLGGGLSAKVRWQVKVRIPNTAKGVTSIRNLLLQFNSETVVTYGEDGFSSLSIRGVMEIPLTRTPSQATRTVNTSVDDFRTQLDNRIFRGVDLLHFRVVRRNYAVSRDKRTMEWDIALEEKPFMDHPPSCTMAGGNYTVRPSKAGMGLCQWMCTLRATYTVRADMPRRVAWEAFLVLLRERMLQSEMGFIPNLQAIQNPQVNINLVAARALVGAFLDNLNPLRIIGRMAQNQNQRVGQSRAAFLIDLTIDEGLYADSKRSSFSASWKLITTFSHIILASGLWKKVPEEDAQGNNLWATSMRDVQGSQSWLANRLDPALDVIVDFGTP